MSRHCITWTRRDSRAVGDGVSRRAGLDILVRRVVVSDTVAVLVDRTIIRALNDLTISQ